MSFGFDQGRLRSMSFQLQPTPLIAWRTVRAALGWAILITILVGASLLWQRYRRQLEPVVKVAKVGFVLYALGSVVFGLMLLYALFSK